MDNQEAIVELLNALKISLTNASVYAPQHPLFIKSVEEIRRKLDVCLNIQNPFKIGIAPDYLLIEGKDWKDVSLYKDLARFFHQRKIKEILIKEDISVEELVLFLTTLSRLPRQLIREGGLQNILYLQEQSNILIEQLDYSELLKDEGEECKDVWIFLFQEAFEKEDVEKLKSLSDNFDKIIFRFKAKDLIEDDELRESLFKFLNYLREHESIKFHKCAKETVKAILKDKTISDHDRIDTLKVFLNDLSEEDLSSALLEEIVADEAFDKTSFDVFARLVDKDRHEKIATSLIKKLKEEGTLVSDRHPNMRRKVKELFAASTSNIIADVYRRTCPALMEGSVPSGGASLDYNQININYRFILLNLLGEEENQQKLNIIIEKIYKEWDKVAKSKDFEYLRCLLELMSSKIEENPALKSVFEDLFKRISFFLENLAFDDESFGALESFLDVLRHSSIGADSYLNKMFYENQVNPHILRLFFQLFPEKRDAFYENLKKRRLDFGFVIKIIGCFKGLNPRDAIPILRDIYSFSNNLIRIEILKAMRGLPEFDEEFLFQILKTENIALKKEALNILLKDEGAKRKALEALFLISAPLGMRNAMVYDNLAIIDEAGLKEARSYLIPLANKPFFWNRGIRNKARELIQRWTEAERRKSL